MNAEISFAVAVALTMGITQLWKLMDITPVKYSALVSLIVGVTLGTAYLANGDLKMGIWQGLAVGLSASGLFSGAKNVIESRKEA